LQLLLSMKHQSWKFIMTLNETWFYFCTDYETIWLAPGEPRPDIERFSKINISDRLESSWFSCAWLSHLDWNSRTDSEFPWAMFICQSDIKNEKISEIIVFTCNRLFINWKQKD
jgi:hypothetical protein